MKYLILRICKSVGLFWLARRITASKVRFLCYHGISIEDEHQFRPGLFMQSNLFKQRLALIEKWQFKVITLDATYASLQRVDKEKDLLTITIDDGWAGIELGMVEPLYQAGYPATLYLSSYYAQKQVPVFNVALAYLLWKAGNNIEVPPDSLAARTLGKTRITGDCMQTLERELTSAQRSQVLAETCPAVGEDYAKWLASGKFMYVDVGALRRIKEKGIDIELHTHRHLFPQRDPDRAKQEIIENRQWIEANLAQPTHHFCYPSGEYTESQFSMLRDLGIRTATTTKNELVDPGCCLLELPRIMDANRVSHLEFEAELTGFMTLFRSLKNRGGK